ncbi:MAG TPA: S41 family peptidase [Ferruginibacter sp.]|nr:S41 family peptidase [Ferruginibacter sp.]
MRFLKLFLLLLLCSNAQAQTCDCEKEFLHIKQFMEHNYAGFGDKLKFIGKKEYDKKAGELQQFSKTAKENCLLIISRYLDIFKDNHIQVSSAFDATKYDSLYISNRPLVNIPAEKIEALRRSTTHEGIYNFNFDSVYTIAVYKDKTPLHDYVGVLIDSKLPHWKRGMLKFEGKLVNDSLMKGILYMRNHMPKVDWFFLGKNSIGGDWQREGTKREKFVSNYQPVASKKLSGKTFYIKISNFNPSNYKLIDSLFKANQETLNSTPNLVLDLRDNGGGADFAYTPILPYISTGPVKTIGVDVLATEDNIAGWKKILGEEDIPEESKKSIRAMIEKMENNKGRLVNIADDETDSAYKQQPYPQKVAVLINRGCASTTEQFLLHAMQSSKVILMGENTDGTLDYSNMRDASFSCMPYTLHYATTRSRRLDAGQGIDDTGIKPNRILQPGTDWIAEAVKILEQ